MTVRVQLVIAAAFLFTVACSCGPPEPSATDTWVVTITTEGTVTTVINESGSVWGGTAKPTSPRLRWDGRDSLVEVDCGDASFPPHDECVIQPMNERHRPGIRLPEAVRWGECASDERFSSHY